MNEVHLCHDKLGDARIELQKKVMITKSLRITGRCTSVG